MEKLLKRSLSLLLAITIIFGSMYVGLSEIDFSGLGVEAKAASPIVTKSQAVAWLNKQQDKVYDFNNANGTQCTEFVRAYVNYVMTGDPWKYCGYTNDMDGWVVWKSPYWTNNKDGWTVHQNTADFMPQPGDIFCAGAFNHTGVVISSSLNSAVIADGNGRDWEWSNGDPVSIRTINWGGYDPTYFIRPRFSDTPVASLATPTITFNKSSYTEGDTITLSWTPSPSNSNLSHYWINVRNPAGNLIINEKIDKSKTSYSFATPGVGTYGVTISATPYGSVSGEGSLTDTKSITINAKTYTVSYNANGGTGAPAAQTKYQNTALTLSSTKPTRSGYTFVGWSTSSTATSAMYAAGGSYTANSSATLYAVWIINTYGVSYLANGGTGSPGAYAHSNGSTHTISSTVPERFGYTFLGWGTSANSSTIYSPGQKYTVTSNTKFYAQWASASSATLNSSYTARIPYAGYYVYYKFTPSYTLNYYFESSGSVDSRIKLYDSNGTELAYDDDSGSDYNFLLNYTLQGGQTYYIKIYAYSNKTGNIPFTIKGLCNITYDANGGADAPSSQETFVGESIYLSSSAPRRCGYTFLGWSESPDATTPQYQPGDAFSVNNNVTLYAVWETSTMANYLEYEIYWTNDRIVITGCDDTYEGELVIPDTIDGYSVVRIEDASFEDCKYITKISIPDSVSYIGNYAFIGCTSLTSVNIPDTVTSIGDYAFSGCASLTSITIPNGVTSIGEYTFSDCTSLTSITIPDSVTTIGDFAFYSCTSLTSITIPDSVTSIGEHTFSGCSSLTSVTVGNGVTSIGYSAFSGCTNLTSVTIGNGVTSIGGWAFYKSRSLTSITIPNSVTSIGNCAFGECTSLTSVTIGNSVTSIGSSAFSNCTSLTSITIPGSVTNIDGSVFPGCTSLTSITVDSSNEYYSSVDGVLFNKTQTELVQYPVGKTDISYTIPNGVTNIGEWAFYNCTSPVSITIPDSVTSIDAYAFRDCSSLTAIIIPDSVTSIGGCAFSGCSGLTSITIPYSITEIAEHAFSGCSSLTSITIPNTVTSIDMSAFAGCDRITSITIPDSVTNIARQAFFGCDSLTTVIIPDSVISIGSDAFYKCTSLITINVDSGNEKYCSVDGVLFNKDKTELIQYPIGRTNMSYTFPDNVTSVGMYAFSYCSSLTSIEIPNCVKNIGYEAFYNCTSLTSITIPDSVTSIGWRAFGGCTNLTSVTIPNSVTSINGSAFSGCTNLTSVTIPNSVTSIVVYAFDKCDSLDHIFYSGTEEEWSNITIGESNTAVEKAIIHYNSTDHSYGEWVIDAEPSCALAGHKHRVCSICNYTDNVEIEATANHDYSDWVVITPPSCVGNGSHSKTCLACGSVYTEEFSGTGHLNTMWIPEQDPTCTVAGYKDEWCLDCGEMVGTEEIPATGHTHAEWTIDLLPTCTKDGSMHSTCSVCSELVTKAMGALGHSYSDEWTIDIFPSCTEAGSKSHHCLACDDIADITVVAPIGHIYSDEWTIDLAPTCTEEGSKSHHCMACYEDVADVTVIEALGHDYELVSVADEHPHTNIFNCSRCTDMKEEDSYSDKCGVCNFSFTNVDSETCKITAYIGGADSFIIPATINGRTVATTTTGAFKNNATLTSVKIEEGVQGLGSLAFLGCKALSKVVIPESVTSIGTNAFYNCASDLTIYCYRDSYAMEYADKNSLNYVVMDVGETENSRIDYDNELIFAALNGLTNLDDILYVPASSMAFAEASHISGNNEYLGTGSIVFVFDGDDISSEYTLIVNGDTNGDSVCDVLDCYDVERAANSNTELSGAYAMAADSNADDAVDTADYQAIVNKALAS